LILVEAHFDRKEERFASPLKLVNCSGSTKLLDVGFGVTNGSREFGRVIEGSVRHLDTNALLMPVKLLKQCGFAALAGAAKNDGPKLTEVLLDYRKAPTGNVPDRILGTNCRFCKHELSKRY
jgi:hypothetical protein